MPVPAPIRRLAWPALFLVACAVAFAVILPLRTGQVGYDSAASVAFFDRIASGRQLEAFVTATPKPLLTVVYGIVHGLTGDWRPISWLAIGAFGLCVVLAARLAGRLGGPAAAGFAATAVLGSASLLSDVALAYAIVWAAIGWLVAGLALTADRPQYGIAGLALLVAGTARLESLIVSVVAVAGLIGWVVLARGGRSAMPPRGAWLLALGLLALPIQLGHDLLLTGDPFFSQLVPVRGSIGTEPIGVVERTLWLIQRYLNDGALLWLGLLGVLALALTRGRAILLGLLALGPGIAAFLLLLEARGIYVSSRYPAPIDVALAFAAAVGFGGLVIGPLVHLIRARAPSLGTGNPAVQVASGLLGGFLFASPFAALDPAVVGAARSNLTLHRNADFAVTEIRAELGRTGFTPRPLLPGNATRDPEGAAILVPPLLRPQLAIDLDLPLTEVDGLEPHDLVAGSLHAGMVIYHDRRGNPPDPAFEPLEAGVPAEIAGLRVVPIASDPVVGWWVVRIEAG